MIPEWKEEIEGEYVEFLRAHGRATPADVAVRLGVSESYAIYWLTDLARNGRIRIVGFEVVEEEETPRDLKASLRGQGKASCPVTNDTRTLDEAA